MEEQRKVDIWGTQSCCCVPEQSVHFLSWTVKAERAEKPQCVSRADLHILQLCCTVTGLDTSQTELSSILEWQALFHDMQCNYPAQLTSLVTSAWDGHCLYSWGPLVWCTQCWDTQLPLRATAPRLCGDTAPCAQAGLAAGDMVNVMTQLLLSPRRAPLSEIPLLYCFRFPEDWLVPVPGHPDCCGVWCCGFPCHLSYHLR